MWWAVSCRSEGSFSSPEKIPAERRDSVRAKLYPFVAGAHAARDSVEAYRWELWIEQGETLYFGLSRPTRSRFPNRREAVVGRVIPSDTGWRHYEELFWTYRFPSDTMRAVVEGLYRLWRKGEDLRNYNEHYVAFPDPYTFYDQSQRRWRRVIAGDTL
ncbi:MAG: hypothetical protein N2170_00080 [Bacteroidia bacterium]|nr:hypothetical protein [Bacteroidia bacterium]